MNAFERIYRSLHYYVFNMAPSGVIVVDGEAVGIRL
jgi:hypothetical protein